MSDEPKELDRATERDLPRVDAVAVTSYSGPLPPPEILDRFEQLYPGSAKLLIDDFLSESAQRRASERKLLASVLFRQGLGAISASLIGLLGISGGLWLAHEGRSLIGLSSVLGTLATLSGLFLYQNHHSDR